MWYNEIMKEHTVRISDKIYKRYKLICVEKDLSVPKQTEAIILAFVETQEENSKRLENSKRYNEHLRSKQ